MSSHKAPRPILADAAYQYPIITASIAGVDCRFIISDGSVSMIVQDLLRLFGYKNNRTSDLRLVFNNHKRVHGRTFDELVAKLPFGRWGIIAINEYGLRLICDLVKPARALGLKQWIEEGGIDQIAKQSGVEANLMADKDAKINATLEKAKANRSLTTDLSGMDTDLQNVPTSAHLIAEKDAKINALIEKDKTNASTSRHLPCTATEPKLPTSATLIDFPSIEEIQAMSAEGLREVLRSQKTNVSTSRHLPTGLPPAAPASQDAAQTCHLHPGDRIRSLHAKRPGVVVRTYPDQSACICWDDGEPQAEGLGHERMPRSLLELVEPFKRTADTARRVDYCRELTRVIARHADQGELRELARALEDVTAGILTRRYSPGLNAAAYEVFRRFGMKGGVQ